MRELSRGALRVWRRNLESWLPFLGSFLVAAIGNPLLNLLAIGYGLGRFVAEIDGLPYPAFLVPGLLAATAMYSASFEATFGSYTRLAEQHTYTAILVTPCSVADVVVGDVLWAATKGVFSSSVLLAVAAVVGLVSSPLACAVPGVALLTGLCFGAMGLAVTARAPSYAFFDYYFTLGIGVMFFFSGVFFPLQSLPGWAQGLAWGLPLTHAAALCRMLVHGELAPLAATVHAAWLLAVTAGTLLLAERLVRRRLIV